MVENDTSETDTTHTTTTHRNVRNGHRPRNLRDDPDILYQMLADALQKFWNNIKRVASFLMVELGGYNAIDKSVQWCVRNPNKAIILLAAVVVFLLPFLIMMVFALSTIVMTFTGFLVFEGTLLTIISMLLFACLGAFVVVFLFFITFGVAAYFGFAHIYDFFGGTENFRTSLINYLQKEDTTNRGARNNNARNDAGNNGNGTNLPVQGVH